MKEYIEKESAENELNRVEKFYRDTYVSKVRAEMVSYCCEVVRHIPSADVVEVRHGRWSHVAYLKGIKVMECSYCGKRVLGAHNYCGNCGAKMDGGVNDA